MQRYTKKSNGLSYIVQSVIVLGVYAVLSAIVTVRVFSATQLSLFIQLAVCGLLWGTIIWFFIVLRRYYRMLPDE